MTSSDQLDAHKTTVIVGPSDPTGHTRRRLRVLHVVPAAFGSLGVFGGAERYVMELASHMSKLTPTTLATFADEHTEDQRHGLKIRTFRKWFDVRGQPCNPFAPGILREVTKYDIVHCHQQHVLTSSLSALICRVTGRRAVVSDLGGGGWDISGYVSTDRWYHAHLHISEYSRRVFGHASQPWAHVIYGGVDTQKFSPASSVHSISHHERRILYVGRLLPHKGVNYLIEALPEDMECDIVGTPYDNAFYEHLRFLAAGKRVSFRINCDDTAVIEAYRQALCVVLPSVYTDMYGHHSQVPELLGQTLLEGMSCGRPGVCSDVASMPEVVQNGHSGWVVPPNDFASLRDRLLQLRHNPERTDAMGRAARECVIQHFTWQSVVSRCLDIYSAVLGQGARG